MADKKPKPKMYTQAQVDKMLAAARKQAKNPIPSVKKTVCYEKEDCTGSDG